MTPTTDEQELRHFREAMKALGCGNEVRWVLEEKNRLQRDDAYFSEVLARRTHGEPLAYIFGHWQFRSFEMKVRPGVLIPRPETEELVDVVLARMKAKENTFRKWHIVDAGAGSGCLGLALHRESCEKFHFDTELTLIEASPEAAEILEENVREIFQADVKIFQGSWMEWVPREKIQLLVSNPPYISGIPEDRADSDVESFEPREALYPKDLARYPDASGPYRELIKIADLCVEKGGIAAFELGAAQETWIADYVAGSYPLWKGQILRDMAGKNRFWIMERLA